MPSLPPSSLSSRISSLKEATLEKKDVLAHSLGRRSASRWGRSMVTGMWFVDCGSPRGRQLVNITSAVRKQRGVGWGRKWGLPATLKVHPPVTHFLKLGSTSQRSQSVTFQSSSTAGEQEPEGDVSGPEYSFSFPFSFLLPSPRPVPLPGPYFFNARLLY